MSAHSPLYSSAPQPCPLPAPPTPLPTPCTIISDNSLELHIPVQIPTPPTPLPIVIAYPLSQSPALPVLVERNLYGHPMAMCPSVSHENDVFPPTPGYASSGVPSRSCSNYGRTMSGFTEDSGLELDPVPNRNSVAGPVIPVFQTEHEANRAAQDLGFELVDISPEELERINFDKLAANGLEEKTLGLFRALNLPVNIHKLRAMRAAGKIPLPLLKLKYYKSVGKAIARPGKYSSSLKGLFVGKKNDHSITDSYRMSGSSINEPPEMETIQGESWYLPSAEARRVKQQLQEEREMRSGYQNQDRLMGRAPQQNVYYQPNLKYQYSQPSPSLQQQQQQRTFAPSDLPSPEHTLLDQFPLPPPSVPVPPQSPIYAHIIAHGYTPTPKSSPTPSRTSSTSKSRPMGYMYAPPTPTRTPSCRSCGSLPSSSPRTSLRHSPAPLIVTNATPQSSPSTNMNIYGSHPVANGRNAPLGNVKGGYAGNCTTMPPPEITIDPAPSPYTAAAAALHYSPKQLPSPQPSLLNGLDGMRFARSPSITR